VCCGFGCVSTGYRVNSRVLGFSPKPHPKPKAHHSRSPFRGSTGCVRIPLLSLPNESACGCATLSLGLAVALERQCLLSY
jgi:hypothetical protein